MSNEDWKRPLVATDPHALRFEGIRRGDKTVLHCLPTGSVEVTFDDEQLDRPFLQGTVLLGKLANGSCVRVHFNNDGVAEAYQAA